MSVISAIDLHKHFGGNRAVDGLSLEIGEGTIYGLVGPDGAGKTTAIRLLCGALAPSSGQIHIAGHPLPKEVEQARASLGYLPQRFSLYEELTVLENLRFFAEVRGMSMRDWRPRAMEILDFVGLAEFSSRRAGALSGGMKQKLGLAAALVHRPKVLLLDEPTTGVDPVTRQSFWQLIIRLVGEEGITALVSTPYMDEAGRCGCVGFLRAGRLLVEGSPADICRGLQNAIVEVTGRPLPRLREVASRLPGVENAQMFGDRLHLRVKPEAVASLAGRFQNEIAGSEMEVEGIRTIPAGLEDVFISLLEQNA